MFDGTTHVQQLREAIPATTENIYLNTGTFGPLPQCSVRAMQDRMNTEFSRGRLGPTGAQREEINQHARQSIARLLNASHEEIALTHNTSEGLNIICYGFDWQAGDEIITTNHEHISGLAPLHQIRDRYGVTIRSVDLGDRGEFPAEQAIEQAITERTRLIVISHISYMTGALFDVRAVAALGHKHGIPTLVDGAQSAGAIPLDMQNLQVDFYALPMQKWLCGPDGTGALYIRRASQALLRPTYIRYVTLEDRFQAWKTPRYAQTLEWGGLYTPAVVGQTASLRWLEDTVHHQWMYQRISELNTYAFNALKELARVTILTPHAGASGLLTFQFAGADLDAVVKRLANEHGISTRSIEDRQSLRISTSFFNTEKEIDTLIQALHAM